MALMNLFCSAQIFEPRNQKQIDNEGTWRRVRGVCGASEKKRDASVLSSSESGFASFATVNAKYHYYLLSHTTSSYKHSGENLIF